LARRSKYLDLPVLAAGVAPGLLAPEDCELLGRIRDGSSFRDLASWLGISERAVYARLEKLEFGVLTLLRSRPDSVREVMESDPGAVRQAASVELTRGFGNLSYAQKAVAGANGVSWRARRWNARRQRETLSYMTEIGYGTKAGALIDAFCRFVGHDLIEGARLRQKVRLDGSGVPPPLWEERTGGDVGEWLCSGSARDVEYFCAALRERLLGVTPDPVKVGERDEGGRLPVYRLDPLFVAARRVPGPGGETVDVQVARAEPLSGVWLRAAREECVLAGFRYAGDDRVAVLVPVEGGVCPDGEAVFEADPPARLYWRRVPGDPWYGTSAGLLVPGDRIRRFESEDAWVLLGGRVRVWPVKDVVAAALAGEKAGCECCLVTAGDEERFLGGGPGGDCAWRYVPASRKEMPLGRIAEVPARLERLL